MNKKYPTQTFPAMRTVDRPAEKIPDVNAAGMMAGMVTPTAIAAIIEVPVMEGCKAVKIGNGTKVAFRHIFEVNGHNYLFTSGCCTECIKLKHKKMLRAYLIHHGMKDGSLKLWWKVWRATR